MKRILWLTPILFLGIAIWLSVTAANAAPDGNSILSAGQSLTIRANGCKLKITKETATQVVVACQANANSRAQGEPEAAEASITLNVGQKQKVLASGCSLSITKKTAAVVKVKCVGSTNASATPTRTKTQQTQATATRTKTRTQTATATRTRTPTRTETQPTQATATRTRTRTPTPTLTLAPPSPPLAISTGNMHACALTAAGGVKCWGYAESGQLGIGSIDDLTECGAHGLALCSPVPLWVKGMTSGIAKIAVGSSTTCAITDGGALKCWGMNYYGTVGDGTKKDRFLPVGVVGMADSVIDVAGASSHTCALKNDHTVYCWGDNSAGELGDGTTDEHLTPVQVPNLNGVEKITVGDFRTCVVLNTGNAKCWGNGPLGDESGSGSTTPVDVYGFTSGASNISAGAWDICLLTTGHGAMCWGLNLYGEVGDGSTSYSPTPQQVYGMESGVNEIRMGGTHACAVLTGGALKCWGYNISGEVGNGDRTQQSYPVAVSGLSSGVTQVSTGNGFTCALASGVPKCWGGGEIGQLGNNNLADSKVPVNVVWSDAPPTATP